MPRVSKTAVSSTRAKTAAPTGLRPISKGVKAPASSKPSFESLLPEIAGILDAQKSLQTRQEALKSDRAASSEAVAKVTKLAGILLSLRLKLYHIINLLNRFPLPSAFPTLKDSLRDASKLTVLQQRLISSARSLLRLHHSITRALLPDAITSAPPHSITSVDTLWTTVEKVVGAATPSLEAILMRWHGATVVAQGGDGPSKSPAAALRDARSAAPRLVLRSQLYRQKVPPLGAPHLAIDAVEAARERVQRGDVASHAAHRQDPNVYDEGDHARALCADVEAQIGAVAAGDEIGQNEGRVVDLARADAAAVRRKRSTALRDGSLTVDTAPVSKLLGFVAARPHVLEGGGGGGGLLSAVDRSALPQVLLQDVS